MHSEPEIRQALREWILGKARDLDPAALTDTTPLFERRYLRSLHVPELLLLLERLRGEPIDVEDLGAGDFRDIDTLLAKFGPARAAS
ncbi:hypothetical protein ACFQY4_23870 [Catellatospora bangladeshensis]|uniref:Acyl carrier protein n=1 Tax=Catellatospora bangladeshensis TaxID=310355 RepID=A0A8J3NGA5_9ACTN|nr:hypothetical protein [Catellatospora bangladeshensis]GIF80185.1 hypothetical protein Cba03nite_15340 [Catellatospora bangladeshensis]